MIFFSVKHINKKVNILQLIMISLRNKATQRAYTELQKENESCWKGPFFFIQGADTQFGMIDSYILRKTIITWDKEIELAKKFITTVNAMTPRPRFVIVCGDLIDAMPGTHYRNAQEEDFMKVFKELHSEIPLICVCGNHDVGNTPTQASIQNYRDKFGDDYFTFFCGGVMFIVLNSQYFEDPSLVQDLAKEQEAWLDQQLLEAKSGKYKHVIIFQHIPWFLREPEEEKEYFNILPELRQKMLKKFYDANVRAIFCGHYHRNAGGFYNDLELVVTSAVGCQLGDDESGFRIVKLKENSIEHKYYTFDKAPQDVIID